MRRPRNDRGDDGFALIFALFATSIVMIGVATVLTIVTPNITKAKRTQDAAAAATAARSGVEDVIAYLVSIPSCRSESRICPAALGASSAALASSGYARPTLGNGQTVSWTTGSTPTADGFVRVTSTGSAYGTSRTVVADLSLRASILAYGYYTDYESFSPAFVSGYFGANRKVYLSDATTFSNMTTAYKSNRSVPEYAIWDGPKTAANCGQHWYYESAASPGRSSTNSSYAEDGRLGNSTTKASGDTATTRTGGCDLAFSAAMVQNGKTFTRDAILSSGSGPQFNQPVYTMWGYDDGSKTYTNPAFPSAGQKYRIASGGTAMSNSPNLPQVASADLTLPSSIGKDGIPDNACVYTGPTRIKLNDDGTATVTSPLTRTKNAASDSGCYPASVATGIVGFRVNYNAVGGGALVARNIGTAPTAGWPANPTMSTNTPSAANEVFYFNATSNDPTQPDDKFAASDTGCTATVKYSASADAPCSWSTVGVTTEGSAATGWTQYNKSACSSAPPTDRELFECEYAQAASTTQPAVDQTGGKYKLVRDNIKADLAAATCVSGTASAQATCVNGIVQARVNPANSSNITTPATGARRYVATTTAAASTTSTYATGTSNGPDGTTSDPLFVQPVPAKVSATKTPLTTVVKRQVYNGSNWTSSDSIAFTLTTTQTNYSFTAARGMTYFPNEQDVTAYNTGTDTTGSAIRGTGQTPQTGDRQPGDVYIEGANRGKLSVLADNDIVITGDITNPSGYTPDSDAVSIAAGADVRNYHPVKCVDQATTDINNTSSGWCPNDITGLYSTSSNPMTSSSGYTAAHPASQYRNMLSDGPRNIYAAVFALSGSFGTDNYNRGTAVGNLNVYGGLYQKFRGGNGVVSGTTELSGTTLQYNFVDLQRADLPYVPPATSGNDQRPWNVVSVSAG